MRTKPKAEWKVIDGEPKTKLEWMVYAAGLEARIKHLEKVAADVSARQYNRGISAATRKARFYSRVERMIGYKRLAQHIADAIESLKR